MNHRCCRVFPTRQHLCLLMVYFKRNRSKLLVGHGSKIPRVLLGFASHFGSRIAIVTNSQLQRRHMRHMAKRASAFSPTFLRSKGQRANSSRVGSARISRPAPAARRADPTSTWPGSRRIELDGAKRLGREGGGGGAAIIFELGGGNFQLTMKVPCLFFCFVFGFLLIPLYINTVQKSTLFWGNPRLLNLRLLGFHRNKLWLVISGGWEAREMKIRCQHLTCGSGAPTKSLGSTRGGEAMCFLQSTFQLGRGLGCSARAGDPRPGAGRALRLVRRWVGLRVSVQVSGREVCSA